ncbi:MAG TPA: MdtA/MuxA family multidrug efflux RND transporter periplasmic adaptor subunit [Casimicrobiaceae bacterium]
MWITTAAIALIAVAVAIGGYYFGGSRNAADGRGQGGTPSAGNPQGGAPSGRRGGGGGDASRPTPVATTAARQGDFDIYLNALGTVTARSTVTVRSRVDGQLLRVLFNEGQVVKAGQLLAEIDPRPFQVQLEQMNGQLAKDQALLANAQVDLERYRTLLKQDSIASQQVDTQASLVRQSEATIASDQGQVNNAKLQLSFTKIVAPIAGRLGLRQVDAGNMIHATDTNGLVVITQVQPIDVIFPIPESNLPRVQRRLAEGDPPIVDAYDRNQTRKLATGKLITIDNQIDTATGTIKLKAAFPNDDSALFPNQFVNVRMLLDTLHGATIIPTAAILRGAPGTFVYVVKDDKTVTVRPVKVGPIEGENAVIDSGVTPGEVVVIDGTDRLREGAKVETVTRGAPAPASADKTQRRPRQPGEGGRKGGGKGSEAPPK